MVAEGVSIASETEPDSKNCKTRNIARWR
jgi:hypothetical protein